MPCLTGAFRPRLFPIAPFGGCSQPASCRLQAARRPKENSRGRQPTEGGNEKSEALEGR